MNAATITLGTIGALLSLVCWAFFLRGVWRIISAVGLGQPAPDRWRPFWPRFKTMIVEFLAHTRMVKFRTVGWAHWLVMIGFLGGAMLWFEAYGQTFDASFHWPIFGAWPIYHLWDELLGIGTVVGILTLMTIRQLNHPRLPERLSRFSGSKFGAAYFVEYVVLLEGLGMIFVKAGKIATYGNANPWTDFFTMNVAKILPASVALVSVFAFIKLMSGMVWLLIVGINITWGVAWHRFSAFPNIYFKREAGGGVALGAAKPMMSGGKPIDMEEADPDNDTFGAGRIEDFSWKGWLDFTTCTECGRCQSQCPAWNTGKPLSPKLLIMSLRDHGAAKAPYLLAGGRKDLGGDEVGLVDRDGKVLEAKLDRIPASARAEAERPLVGGPDGNGGGGVVDPEVLWSCTTCGACVEQCPVDIEHVDHIIDMRRYQVLIESEFPSELAGLFKNLENKGNPWGQNAKDRLNWISELDFDVPVFGQDAETFEDYEYLFWVGCAGAYEDRAKRTTKAVAELLATAGVKFMVLGAEETCTGDSARRAGNEFLFQQLAMQNIELLNSVFEGVEDSRRKIVVTCAHCFNALGNEYPQIGASAATGDGNNGKYEVVHHTQLLNRLVRAKKLVPVARVDQSVTYHDPCYLGRHNKVYDAPRELMAASGSTLTEMPRHAERSMCCGAGGARMWMEEQLGKRINIDRVDEALATLGERSDGGSTQPAKIATGCPFCRVMLSDGVTARQADVEDPAQKVEVVDVAQLMLDAVTRLEPAALSANLRVEPRERAPIEAEEVAEEVEAERIAEVEEPAETPAETATPAKAVAAKGLGMKGLAKAPGAKAPGKKPAETAEAAPAAPAAKGLAMKGPAKAPGKGLAMKGAAKAPGAKAPGADAPAASTEAQSTEAKPAVAAKGLGMKTGLKKPGTKAAPAAAAPAPAEPAETPAVAASEAKPAVAAKGLAMKSGLKRPGPKAPTAAAPATPAVPAAPVEPAEPAEPAAEAPTTPASEIPQAVAPSAETKPTVAAKGLAMKSGFRKPGPRGSASAASAPASAPAPAREPKAEPEPEAKPEPTPQPEAANPEPSGAAEPTADSTGGNGSGATPPPAKPGGLGFRSGARVPGRRG